MGIPLFTLRPDANLRRDGDATTLPTEYDTRSGNVVTATPSLRLLDLYELTFIDTAAFQFGYGVYENVYGDSIFYSEELEFGLRPRFPRKYAGLRLTWRSSPTGADTNLESSYSKYELTISTIEASNDRHEKFTSSSKSDDAAPSSQDAYIGGAFSTKYRPSRHSHGLLFLGYLDQKVDFGKKNQLMAAVETQTVFHIGKSPTILNFESRYIRERYTVSEGNFP